MSHASKASSGVVYDKNAVIPNLLYQQAAAAEGKETNKSRVTWRRAFDFTLTVVGYTVGIHDFWRFPYQCYRYGGVFYIPFILFMIIFYFPGMLVEFTIGQHYGQGSTAVFGELAPILTGISYILAWNSLTSCWLYAMMISWTRLYSDDATSCKQGWHTCHADNYYNSIYCFTGQRDNDCAKKHANDVTNHSSQIIVSDEVIFYKFRCSNLTEFCDEHQAKALPGTKSCECGNNSTFSVFEKRSHASAEYFYGGLGGLKKVPINKTENVSSCHKKSEKDYKYVIDPFSASEDELLVFSFTTFAIIAFFLHEGLLAVSVITYLLNLVPFIALGYFTIKALSLPYSLAGVKELFSLDQKNFESLINPRMWADAVVQVICSTGIGNGVLINLSTFNRHEHNYLFDTSIAALLNTICSTCATLICFSTISNVIISNKMDVEFRDFIKPEADYSSLEFGYIIYTLFLTLIKDEYLAVMLFFFMISSFSMDSALRLVQNTLDAMTTLYPRLRRHRLASLSGICLFGFAAVLPMTRNGGVLLFLEYEYFMVRFIWPMIVFFQLVGVTWIYGASRIMDHCEQIGLVGHIIFRKYIIVCVQYIMPVVILFVIGFNIFDHFKTKDTSKEDPDANTSGWKAAFGWILLLSPIWILMLSIADQLLATPKDRWHTLRAPVGRSTRRSVRRRTGLSITNYGVMSLQREQSESGAADNAQGNVLKAISKWRAGGGAVMFGKKHSPNSNNNNDNQSVRQSEAQSVKGSIFKLNSFIKSNLSINTNASKMENKPKKNSLQSQNKKLAEDLSSIREPSEVVTMDEFQISDTELEQQFEKIYEQIQERSQFGILSRKWKAIVEYLDKWPGRFEEIEEIESNSESSSDDEVESESQSLKSTDDEGVGSGAVVGNAATAQQ